MKCARIMCLAMVLCLAVGTLTPASSHAQAQQAPAPSVASIVESQIKTIENDIVPAAEAMPEDKFNFVPSNLDIKGSDYKGVRSFADQVKHVAGANFFFWSALTGEKPPMDRKALEALKSKAEIVKLLKDSYALGHRAAASLTMENIMEQVPFGQGKQSRLYLATFAVAHGFDHYGQLVEYLRMNGIVPPASQR